MSQKKNRLLEIFFRAMRGVNLSVKDLANEYEVSTKSISRDMNEIKNFLSDNRDIVGNTELKYDSNSKTYYLELDHFLLSKELIAIIKTMIGSRALNKMELLQIIAKLKNFTASKDRLMVEKMIAKEMYHYNEINHDCESVADRIWQLTRCIYDCHEITVSYYKSSREKVNRRVMPVAILFSEYYFYLIAYRCDKDDWKPLYYRIDRVNEIVEHRKRFEIPSEYRLDEGELRNKIQFMQPGNDRKIRFSYEGDSVQAILDRIPTAKIVEINDGVHIIEAETYGDGINMYLLAQGTRVKALAPKEFVEEMRNEISALYEMYHSYE